LVKADGAEDPEGNIGGAKRRESVPEACEADFTGVIGLRHAWRGSPRNLGDPDLLRRETELPSKRE